MTTRNTTCLALVLTAVGAGTYIYLSEDRLREAPMTQSGEESAVSREEVTPVVPVGDFLYPNEPSETPTSSDKLVEVVDTDNANPPTIPPPLPPTPEPSPKRQCRPGGCSGQLCTDQPDLASTCEWREEYACYHTAVCERQISGECGWRDTPELQQCLLIKSQGVM